MRRCESAKVRRRKRNADSAVNGWESKAMRLLLMVESAMGNKGEMLDEWSIFIMQSLTIAVVERFR